MNRVRTFRGTSSKEIMKVIRKELGEDAIVLSTKKLPGRNGVPSMLQIEAAVSPSSEGSRSPLPNPSQSAVMLQLAAVFRTNGVQKKIADQLLATYSRRAGNANQIDPSLLKQVIDSAVGFSAKHRTRKSPLALVGPTGVGKTTTIAKLAARDILAGRRVGLITIDHHRLAGVEELRQFAALIEAPVIAITSAKELDSAIELFHDCDRIYIDTAGSGALNQERLQEMQHVFSTKHAVDRMLVLPASSNLVDLRGLVSAYRKLGIGSLSVTKVDETFYFGPCFSLLVESKLPLEFFGTGPQVPEDLELAGASKIVKLIGTVTH